MVIPRKENPMFKKATAIILTLTFVLALQACSFGKIGLHGDESTSAETQSDEVTAEVTTEQTAESTEESATEESLTEKVTEIISVISTTLTTTTTKPATTKPATTKPATTRPATTKPSTTRPYEGTTEVKKESHTVELKYGVIRSRSEDVIYAVNADGSRTRIGSNVNSELYNRVFFVAEYNDMLPAARENRQTYASFISEVLRLTNAMRAEGGLAPLTLSDKLTEQANVRAEELAWSGKHSHNRPGGPYFSSIFRENGFTSGKVGENIGWGYDSPAAVCKAWRESQTHYENIMNPEFKSIGIGVAADCDPSGKLCWVQHFYSE